MKNRKAHTKRLKKSNALLIEALKRAYLDAIGFLNEGDFKRKVIWDAGYIQDAIDFSQGIPKRKEPNENTYDDSDFDDN